MLDWPRQQRHVEIARWRLAQAEQRLSGQYARVSWLNATGWNRDVLMAATRTLDTFEQTLGAMRRHVQLVETLADAWSSRTRLAPLPKADALICPSDHMSLLCRVLQHYGLPPASLQIVPDVYAWSWKHGIPETSLFRQAKCIELGEGRCLIAMRSNLYDSMTSARKVAMELLGLDVDVLDSGVKYIAQLLLREIAYVMLKSDDEKYRDEWALAELPKHIPSLPLH